MKRVLGVAVVALAIGGWASVHVSQSASAPLNKDAVLAIVLGGNLVLCISVWYVARRACAAVKAMPLFALLTVAMLFGMLPKLFWPGADDIHTAGTIASVIVSTNICLMQIRRIVIEIRRQRSLHPSAARP